MLKSTARLSCSLCVTLPHPQNVQRRHFSRSSATFKLAAFERHLHEQAVHFGISPKQPPRLLRVQIKESVRTRLKQLGFGTDGELPELRERLRQAEMLLKAKALGIPLTDDFEKVKQQVFEHYRSQLKALHRSPRGNLHKLVAKLSQIEDAKQGIRRQAVEKTKKSPKGGKGKVKGGAKGGKDKGKKPNQKVEAKSKQS